MDSNENIYAAPESNVEVELGSSNLASRGKRFGAAFIDGIISMIVTVPIMFLTGGFASEMPVLGDDGTMIQPVGNSILYTLGLTVFSIIVFFVIHATWLFSKGQTIGKLILNIKIAKADGSMLEKSDIFKRYGVYMGVGLIPFIGGILSLVNICFIFRKDKLCGHDLVAKTVVVDV